MRKLLLGTVASAAFLAAPAAMADVNVLATITKDADIEIIENITIRKDVDIDVAVDVQATKAAEADTIVNQENYFNEACENCAEKFDWIVGSVTGHAGIVSVNQATGNMNNQGNAVTVSIDSAIPPGDTPPPQVPPNDPGDPEGFANAQSSVSQTNGGFIELVREGTDTDPTFTPVFTPAGNIVESINIIFREARITASINDNTGVVHVNQATGNMANQTNVFTAALALSNGVALSESDLGQWNTENSVSEASVRKTAVIEGSILNNSGAVGVNQSSGNMANQANVMTFGAAIAIQ